MKIRLQWRAHNPTGWAEAVAGLSPVDEWALLRLLDAQWTTGTIPASQNDVLGLLRFLGLDNSLAKHLHLSVVLGRFFPLVPGSATQRANAELFDERERAKSRADAMSDRNRRAARARWSGGEEPT